VTVLNAKRTLTWGSLVTVGVLVIGFGLFFAVTRLDDADKWGSALGGLAAILGFPLPGLAQGTKDLGLFLSEAGNHDRALAPARTAVTMFRALAKSAPGTFAADLAMSLQVYAEVSANVEADPASSLVAVQEAVGIYENLNSDLPGAFVRLLLAACRTKAQLLDRLGQEEEEEEAAALVRHISRITKRS